jgi:hypothetical protein
MKCIRFIRHPKGGGWAKPKNGVAHFWAWGWRCGVSEATRQKPTKFLTRCPKLANFQFFTSLSQVAKKRLNIALRFPACTQRINMRKYTTLFLNLQCLFCKQFIHRLLLLYFIYAHFVYFLCTSAKRYTEYVRHSI